jgi:hypothetical protein
MKLLYHFTIVRVPRQTMRDVDMLSQKQKLDQGNERYC